MTPARLLRPAALLTCVLAAAIGVAACGGKSANPSPAGSSSTSATAVASVTIPDGATVIDQQDLTFKPSTVTVKVGGQVYFKNSESTFHTVDVQGKNISGVMKKGSVIVWTAPAAGTYKITCDYHPQMHATITVTP